MNQASACWTHFSDCTRPHQRKHLRVKCFIYRVLVFSCTHLSLWHTDLYSLDYCFDYFFTAVKVRQTVHLSGDPCNSYDIRCGFFDHRSCRRLLIVGFKNKHIVSWTLFKCDIFFHSIFCIKWPVIIVYLNSWQDQSIIFRVLRLESPNWWFRSDESHTFYFTYRFIIVDIWSCNKRCWPLRAL